MKFDCRPGYTWCKECGNCVPGPYCQEHMTEKPVTLDRYEAGALFKMGRNLGIDDNDPKYVISYLAGLLAQDLVFYSYALKAEEINDKDLGTK